MPAPGNLDTTNASCRRRNEPERRPRSRRKPVCRSPYQGGLAMPLARRGGAGRLSFSCIRARHDTKAMHPAPMDAHTQCLGRNVAHMFAPLPSPPGQQQPLAGLGASLVPSCARPMSRSNPRRDRLSSRAHCPPLCARLRMLSTYGRR